MFCYIFSAMVTIMQLPYEIILTILKNKDISIKDIVNFSSTCKKFRRIIDDNNVWKKKFSQRWYLATRNYYIDMGLDFYYANFADVQGGINCTRKMWHYVSRMSEKYYYCNDRYEDRDIFKKDIVNLFFPPDLTDHPLNYSFLYDELITSIYKQSPSESNLTQRYYTIQIFQYLNRYNFKSRWQSFKNRHKQDRRLEDIIVMLLGWYQPDKGILEWHVDKFIDNIVQEVLKNFKTENFTHPILLISSEQFTFWKNNNISQNYWSEIAARPILYILSIIISKFASYNLNLPWLKLNPIDTDRYTIKERKLYYKRLFWLIMYSCVARRLGIRVILSAHFPLRSHLDIHLTWKPRICRENIECFNIDWIENQPNIMISNMRRCQLVPYPTKMSSDFIADMLKTILGYYCLWPMDSNVPQYFISSSMRYFDVSICTPQIENYRKKRSPKLKFAIGLIVTHKHEDVYRGYKDGTAGVIIGWHKKCQIKRFRYPNVCCTPHYIKNEYIRKYSKHGWKSQPYYVLLIDNDLCYVPQYVITSVCKTKINNAEIGKYFCGFEGTHYVPNEMLARYYPDDAAAVREILNNNK